MGIDDLLQETTEWLKGIGPEAEIAISSRVRLARNIRGNKFCKRATPEIRRQILEKVIGAAAGCQTLRGSLVVELEKCPELDRQLLLERHLISRDLSRETQGAVIVGPGEVISLMINEEDHIRIQVLQSGLQLLKCWKLVDRVDSQLEKVLDYEFSPELGYLTACPTNIGTGIRASVMLHLPALVINRQINQVLQGVHKLGLAIRGTWGEGTQASGNMFQISNQVTLGKSEETIIADLDRIIHKIIAYERQARTLLLQSRSPRLEDQVYRALGILKNARLITSEETLELLSSLRVGVNLGILKNITRAAVNELFIHTRPAHLQKMAGKLLSSEERDLLRARLIREKLAAENPGP
jgi:protein arginine kinase